MKRSPSSPSCRALFSEQCLRMPSRVSNVRFRPGKRRVALFELVDDAQRLQVVLEAAVLAHAVVQRILAGVAERRVAEVVRKADRFGQRFVELQRPRDGAGDLRDFDRVREPRAVQVAFVIDEHLRLVDQAPERGGMDDAIAVALDIRRGNSGGGFGMHAAPRCARRWRRKERAVRTRRSCAACASQSKCARSVASSASLG